MALNTISASGTQTATQSPQASTGATTTTGTASGNIQPGITSSSLASRNGVPLQNTALPTISLTSSSQAVQSQNVQVPPQHHVNPVLLGFSIILFIVAAVSFWITTRSAKKTTDYS